MKPVQQRLLEAYTNKTIVHLAIDLDISSSNWYVPEYLKEVLEPLSYRMRELATPIPQIWVSETKDYGGKTEEIDIGQEVYRLKVAEQEKHLDFDTLFDEDLMDESRGVNWDKLFSKYPDIKAKFDQDGIQVSNNGIILPDSTRKITSQLKIPTGIMQPTHHHLMVNGQSTDPNKDLFVIKGSSNAMTSSSLPNVLAELGTPDDILLVLTGQSYIDCLGSTLLSTISEGYECVVLPEITNYIGYGNITPGKFCDVDGFAEKMITEIDDPHYRPTSPQSVDAYLSSGNFVSPIDRKTLEKRADAARKILNGDGFHVCSIQDFHGALNLFEAYDMQPNHQMVSTAGEMDTTPSCG